MEHISFDELERRLAEVDGGDDRAYDGSDEPQKRPLTARERDVLCRIITAVLHDERYDDEEGARLLLIRHVIDPRND
jgi:hypothetical protein